MGRGVIRRLPGGGIEQRLRRGVGRPALLSLDDLLEVMNQAAIWIAKKDYKNDFWKAESFLKVTLPKWKKWQKAWKNRITHYTPRVRPATHSDVALDGVIEEWDPKKPKGTSQIKTIMVSPMFGPEIVDLYKKLNEKYDPAAQIKSKENLRKS